MGEGTLQEIYYKEELYVLKLNNKIHIIIKRRKLLEKIF